MRFRELQSEKYKDTIPGQVQINDREAVLLSIGWTGYCLTPPSPFQARLLLI